MSLVRELLAIERGFWLGGEAYFLAHLDHECLLAFPGENGMHGIRPREEAAATAGAANRWRELDLADACMIRLGDAAAIISYRATARRADGEAYSALVGSAYVARADGWKLAFHQHSPV